MMRHADSNDSGGGRDIDRSITETGRQSARQVLHPSTIDAAA